MKEKEKRTWYYITPPQGFDIVCPCCNGNNLAWSEFVGNIWCYDCEKDLDNYHNPMSGPVPMQVAAMLGFNFDIYNMETQKVERYNFGTEQYELS
jgi:hypothetical protein